MFANLTGRFTASHPPDSNADQGRVAHGGVFPSRELEDPLANQRPFTGPLDPTAMPLVGVAAGCNLSEPSRVAGPSGSTSHTATAMDPVHGSQWSVSSTDITLTAKQGAAPTSSYGSNSMGEVSTGTASTGQRSQPTDAARQLFIVDDTALTGHSSHLAAIHGDTPMEVEIGPAMAGPLSPPALPDQMGISLPGISRLTGSRPSLSGVRPPPGFTGTPMGSGEFSGLGQTPAVRQAPPLHFGGIRPLPNRTTATITSFTAPAVTMASYGGVSTSTSLGRPISSLGIAQNNQVSAPLGQNQQQWSGAIPQGVQLPYTQGTSDIPLDQALNRVFPGGIPAAMEQYLTPTWNQTLVRSVGSLDRSTF